MAWERVRFESPAEWGCEECYGHMPPYIYIGESWVCKDCLMEALDELREFKDEKAITNNNGPKTC